MQDQTPPRGHHRYGVAREDDIDESGLRPDETRERPRVRLFDERVIERRGERGGAVAIALRGWLPVERDAGAAGGDDVVGEARQADVDDRERLLEQRLHAGAPSRRIATPAASVAASKLLAAMTAPAFVSVAICLARF